MNLRRAAKDYSLDGMVWNYINNCRPLAITSHLGKTWLEETTGLPTLSLEVNYYDSRHLSLGNLKTRLEAFAEMLRKEQ
jgi:benzoyl-CoA reductase/2-hydroxyglutaryl-CoA dehydratase subunit BcrC/BadD/HgdB